jgi:hypothetical protein
MIVQFQSNKGELNGKLSWGELSIIVLFELRCTADRAFFLVLLQNTTADNALGHVYRPLAV